MKHNLIDLEKEPLIVQQAYYTAKGSDALGDKKLILELSNLLAKHSVKSVLKIKEGNE